MTRATVPTGVAGLMADPVSGAAARQLTVGTRHVHAMSDGYLLMSKELVAAPGRPTAGHDALAGRYTLPRLPLGCFLVPGPVTILVDTGIGPVDFGGQGRLVGGRLLAALASVGVVPDDVDVVALSHLHEDHAGTLTDLLTGEPTFPRARVHVGLGDWEHFLGAGSTQTRIPARLESGLRELRAAGRVVLMDGDGELAPGVRRLATPGHTPGHSFYEVSDGSERLVLVGDALHCPQQLDHPEWFVRFDADPSQAVRVRESLRGDLLAHGGAALGSHFPALLPQRPLGSRDR